MNIETSADRVCGTTRLHKFLLCVACSTGMHPGDDIDLGGRDSE
jgi:hypothetical protein